MSLDFLVGFTVFMLALIMVMSMVPGLLAGLESSGIDYDAVAYRTGVILVEDPGWPANPEYPDYKPWEVWYAEGKKENITRIGLAVSKESPNVLPSAKVKAFFDGSFFDQGDYRGMVIFGDIPYSYNISLRSEDGTYMTGNPLPLDYGYIRRLVKIKEPGATVIDGFFNSSYNGTDFPEGSTERVFTVRLDFAELLNPSIDAAYRIDPRVEPVNVTITNFSAYRNETATENATLKNVTVRYANPGEEHGNIPESGLEYTLFLDDGGPYDLKPNAKVNETIFLVLEPVTNANFLGPYCTVDIEFTFDSLTNIDGIHRYNYANVTRPPLKPAVLEVAIW